MSEKENAVAEEAQARGYRKTLRGAPLEAREGSR